MAPIVADFNVVVIDDDDRDDDLSSYIVEERRSSQITANFALGFRDSGDKQEAVADPKKEIPDEAPNAWNVKRESESRQSQQHCSLP